MNRRSSIYVLLALLTFIAGVVAWRSYSGRSAEKIIPPLAGSYLTHRDDGISWVVFRDRGNGSFSCSWHYLHVVDNGEQRNQSMNFSGAVSGEHFEIQADLPSVAKIGVMATGERAAENLHLTVRAADATIFTGQFKPVGTIELASAIVLFHKQHDNLLEKIDESNLSALKGEIPTAPVPSPEEEQATAKQALLQEGNGYIGKLEDYSKHYKEAENQLVENSASIKEAYDVLEKVPHSGYVLLRIQIAAKMKHILGATQNVIRGEEVFGQLYRDKMMPFFARIKALKETCPRNEKVASGEKTMCAVTDTLYAGMGRYAEKVRKAYDEVRGVYQVELQKQQELIRMMDK